MTSDANVTSLLANFGERSHHVYLISLSGQYLRKSVRSNAPSEWSAVLSDAEIFGSRDLANARLTTAARDCGDEGPWPQIPQFELSAVRVIDCSDRLNKNRVRAKKAQLTRDTKLRAMFRAEEVARIERLRLELQRTEASVIVQDSALLK